MGYQVPMIEVAVIVALAGVDPEEHFLYLAPYSERREGPETVADYLNGTPPLLPDGRRRRAEDAQPRSDPLGALREAADGGRAGR